MRVVLLMNFIAPYRVPLLEALRDRVGKLRVLISVAMERDRSWVPDWGTLDVAVQRNVVVRRPYKDPTGFMRALEIHVPVDTLPRLVAERPDAVISGELGMRSFQVALYKSVRRRMPFLIWATLSEHSERNWGRARTMLRRFILSRADGVFVNGESGARYIATFGIPDGRIFRINQPVDVARFAAEPRREGDAGCTRLLHSGTLTARKGVVPLAKALVAWSRANPGRRVEMTWLGGGELQAELEALELPGNLSFRFLGQVAYSELPAAYAQADLLAFPTLLDEWGLVVNEAMACGLPVLGSIYGQAVEELVEDGVNGWTCDPRKPGSLEDALARALATGPDEMARMREAARARIGGLTPGSAARRMADAVVLVREALTPPGRAGRGRAGTAAAREEGRPA